MIEDLARASDDEQRARATGLGNPLRDYAAFYQVSPRTVKRWRAIGARCGDPVPLDSPGEMLGWWQRQMNQRPTVAVQAAIDAARRMGHPQIETPAAAAAAMRGLYPVMCACLGVPPSPPSKLLWEIECDRILFAFGDPLSQWLKPV
jgi:hypothetical protein